MDAVRGADLTQRHKAGLQMSMLIEQFTRQRNK